MVNIRSSKEKQKKKNKYITAFIIVIAVIVVIGCILRKKYESSKQYEYACENSSWNNLKNVEKNIFLLKYRAVEENLYFEHNAGDVDTQYKEYRLYGDGIKLYNQNFKNDKTNLLDGSNYNQAIMNTASNIIFQHFFTIENGKIELNNFMKRMEESMPRKEFAENEREIAYKKIASYIHTHIKYDKALSNEMNENDVNGKVNQSAIATFNSGEGVCEGISELYAAMCRSVGLPVKVVVGTLYDESNGNIRVKAGNHAWNEVLIDGKWRIYDVTNYKINGLPENYEAKEILEFR